MDYKKANNIFFFSLDFKKAKEDGTILYKAVLKIYNQDLEEQSRMRKKHSYKSQPEKFKVKQSEQPESPAQLEQLEILSQLEQPGNLAQLEQPEILSQLEQPDSLAQLEHPEIIVKFVHVFLKNYF